VDGKIEKEILKMLKRGAFCGVSRVYDGLFIMFPTEALKKTTLHDATPLYHVAV
jgi:hypothetical protein